MASQGNNKPLVNERIPYEQMQLITNTGENIGVISRKEALQHAEDAGLDLVIVADKGAEGYPIAKIVDFGKMVYAKKKQQKKQHTVQVKEVKLRPKIAEHDYQTKLNQAVRFLKKGNRLKVTIMFRGREMAMKDTISSEMFQRVEEFLENFDYEGKELGREKEMKTGQFVSRTYTLKNK